MSNIIWSPQPRQRMVITCPFDELLFGGSAGSGKAQSKNSLVLTPKGFVKMGDVKVGLDISDPVTGGVTKVIAIHPRGVMETFRVTFDDGASCVVSKDHLWLARSNGHLAQRPRTKASSQLDYVKEEMGLGIYENRWSTMRVMDTQTLMKKFEEGDSCRIPLTSPVRFTVNGRTGTGSMEPYLAGLLLGDGCVCAGSITMCAVDPEIREYIQERGFTPSGSKNHTDGEPMNYIITGDSRKKVDAWLRNNNLRGCRSWEKFIPPYVFTSSIHYRLEFLRGLVDTDGTVDDRGHCSFCSTSEALANGVQELVRSLGGKASITSRIPTYTYNEEKLEGRLAYNVMIWMPRTSVLFKIKRKQDRCTDSWNGGHEITRGVKSIERVGEEPVQCITVDSFHGLYITDDYIVTHNSDLLVGDWIAHMSHSPLHEQHASGVLFRNSFPELQEILMRMQEIYPAIGGKWKDKDSTWYFPKGATLRLAYLNCFEDALQHKGFSYSWRAHDELTQRPTDAEFVYIGSRMRSAHGVKIRTLSATNPDGPGHLWVKRRYKIDQYPSGMHPIHNYTNINTNRPLEEDEGAIYDSLPAHELPAGIRRNTRIFIPGRLSDNKYLNDDGHYRAGLLALPEAQRRMLLEGRWDIVEGAFFDEWDPHYHVVKAFKPPEDWKRWMAGDWGTSAPYAFGWFCQSPGGEIFIYRELVGYSGKDFNKGVKEPPSVVADRIKALEAEAGEWIQERWLDASCFDNEEMGLSVSEQFRRHGVVFQRAQKKFKSGSIAMLRDYMKITNGMCRFHIMDNCQYGIQTIPLLMVDKNNVEQYDSSGPDHFCLRYDTTLLTPHGWVEVHRIQENDKVWTPVGWKPCVSLFTGVKPTKFVKLSNGHILHATEDHKFLTTRGFLPLTEISTRDIMIYGGAEDESSRYIRQDPGVPGQEVLPLRLLLPEERETPAPDGVDVPQRCHPQGIPCPPSGRGQESQPYLKFGIEDFFRAFEYAHVHTGAEGLVEGEHQESHCSGTRMAQIGSGTCLAPGTCQDLSRSRMAENEGHADPTCDLLPMLTDVPNEAGESFLFCSLQNERMEPWVYGVRVEEIGDAGSVPVFDIGVEEAHCALIGAGVFASNCDAVLYGIRRNIKTREEISRERGVSERNNKVLRRFGGYGAR